MKEKHKIDTRDCQQETKKRKIQDDQEKWEKRYQGINKVILSDEMLMEASIIDRAIYDYQEITEEFVENATSFLMKVVHKEKDLQLGYMDIYIKALKYRQWTLKERLHLIKKLNFTTCIRYTYLRLSSSKKYWCWVFINSKKEKYLNDADHHKYYFPIDIYYDVPWSIKRLIWIANMKDEKNEFYTIPKEIIKEIISYSKSNTWTENTFLQSGIYP